MTTRTIYFTNPGEIDIRGATIAGLSAKDDPTSAIGEFGTGLKYAISCILRWSGQLSITSGLSTYTFQTETIHFRGQPAERILMQHPDGTRESLAITTSYGKNWQPWQVFRELFANARDEGGTVSLSPPAPAPNTTIIAVSCNDLLPCYDDRDTIILPASRQPLFANSNLEIHPGTSSHLYYKRVRVSDRDTLYTYNFLNGLQLTEDRTLSSNYAAISTFNYAVVEDITDETILRKILTAPKSYFERSALEMAPSYLIPSQSFLATALSIYKKDSASYPHLLPWLQQHSPDDVAPVPLTLTPFQQRMFDKALGYCDQLGLPATLASSIIFHEVSADNLGTFNRTTRQITLSPKLFNMGMKELTSTLYEELTHASTGLADCTYDLQTYLFNKVLSMFEEHVLGEPL